MADEKVEEVVEQKEVDPAIRKRAEAQGWSDKDQWKGDPNLWVDADTFVKRGDEWLKNLKKDNDFMSKELKATQAQLQELRATTEEFKKFQVEAHQRKVAELETQLTSLKEERAQAISDGDGKKVNALDDVMDKTKDNIREVKQAAKEAAKPAPKAPEPTAIDPSLQAWLGENEWFGKDRRMTSIANGIGESLRLEFPDLKGQEFLDKLNTVLAEEFPARFGKTSSPRSPVESGSGSRGGGSKGAAKSYENLPAEAKAACDRYVKQKLLTREQYVDSFDWS
jgi:hypothetical protein